MAMTSVARDSGSLRDVLHAIPPDCYKNPTWKGLAYFGRDVFLYGAIVVALILTTNPIVVVLLWMLGGLAVSALFVTGHDAAHQSLFKHKRLNEVIGRIAMLPSLHLYSAWVYGHNRVHHGFTIRQGVDFVWHPTTPEQFTAMSKFHRLRHRVEWSFLGAGLYYLREVWWTKMIHWTPPQRWRRDVYLDRLFVGGVLVLAAVALAAYDPWASVRVIVGPFLAFTYIIGTIVHVHHVAPDIAWLKRDEWTRFAAQMQGTTVLRAPKGLNFFLHWIMVHVPHHVDMRIPMYNLERATDAIEQAFPGTVVDEPMRFRTFIANSRACKLFDFETGQWSKYPTTIA